MYTHFSRGKTMVKMCCGAMDTDDSIHHVLPDNTVVLSAPSTAAGLSHHLAISGPLENMQDVSLSEDLFISDDSSVVYNLSSSEKSSSDNEEIENAQDIQEVEHLTCAVNNTESSIQNKKGRGRNKLDEKDKTRKRKRNPSGWERNRRYEARSKGNPYCSTSKKYVPGKALKGACTCKRKCREKLTEETRLQIFQDFYALDSNSQNQFLAQCFEEIEKKVERLRQNQRPSRRRFTLLYFLYNNEGHKIQVCRSMFLNTLDIKPGKMKVIAKKKRHSTSGFICPADERGKHGHQQRICADSVTKIEDHIKSFPSYVSHYSRSHTEKKYLLQDLNISKMYTLYKEHCSHQKIVPELESFYRKIFVENFNLSFHHPSNDTCAKCDKYKIQINACTDLQEKAMLEETYNQHLAMAGQAYNLKKEDKSQSVINEHVAFLCFDLQKCLPTPMLQNNISFYKRCLWTYNLTVYSCVSKRKHALCYIWDESIGGRGGQEIASCLRQYILTIPTSVTEINIFSDCCTGQTRNIYLAVMFSLMIENCNKNARKLVINHKFLEPGHTHLEADTIHAAIEKVKKNTTAKIEIPRDWANLIRLVPRKPPIEVIEMKQTDLLNFENLLKGHYVHRKLNSEKERINWFQIKWLQYSTLTPTKVLYKKSFSSSEPFKVLDLARKNISNETYSTRSSSLTRVKLIEKPTLIPINKNLIPLPEKKMKDLKDLMPFLSETSRSFYEQLISGPTVFLENEYLPDEQEN